jgi:acyl-CoA reductase-like NAD-dependent aldehyde dehydrogenase
MQLEQIRQLGRGHFQAQAATLRPEVRMVIHGELTEAASGRRFETINPATDGIIASVPSGDAEEIDRAVTSARRMFREGVWSHMEPLKRAEVLYRYAELIEENALELALLDTLDVGKPIVDTLTGDVPAAALTFGYFGEAIDKFAGLVTSTAADAFHYILREPLGVVACILPWNYPLLIGAWKIGNSVVIKPAQLSPLSATKLAMLFLAAGGPPGVLNPVHGGGSRVGKALALHMDVDKIGFTGSTETGKLMMVYSGQSNMKRVTVETGGKSPQIITSDVPDLDAAVHYAVTGIYTDKGEMCSAGSRLLAHEGLHDEFVDRFKAKTRELMRLGDPLDPGTTMGPLVSRSAQQAVLGAVATGREEGAHLVLGG